MLLVLVATLALVEVVKLKAVVESSLTDQSGRAKMGWTISQPSARAARSSPKRWRTPLRRPGWLAAA